MIDMIVKKWVETNFILNNRISWRSVFYQHHTYLTDIINSSRSAFRERFLECMESFQFMYQQVC